MTQASAPLAEITDTAIRVLCREIGPVNTARFLNQFTTGFGNYTEERGQSSDERTVEELVAAMRQLRPRKRGSRPSSRTPDRPRRRDG